MEKKKISVIIPVYNVMEYLERCVSSVLRQTYRNLEVILIDDGSPDDSGVLCDRIAQSDTRVSVINTENRGTACARNSGLDAACGDYISFIDSDDIIEADMLSLLAALIENNHSEMSVCSFMPNKNGVNMPPRVYSEKTRVLSVEEALRSLFEPDGIGFSACNKLFSAKLFGNLRFREGILMEDKDITYRIISQCTSVAYCDAPKYIYFMSENSVMRSDFCEKKLISFEINERMERFFCEKYPRLVRAFRCYGVKLGVIELAQMSHFHYSDFSYYEKSAALLRKGFICSLFTNVVSKRYTAAAVPILLCRFFRGGHAWESRAFRRLTERIYSSLSG